MAEGSPSIFCVNASERAPMKGVSPSAPSGSLPRKASGSVLNRSRRGSLVSGSAHVTRTVCGGIEKSPGTIGVMRQRRLTPDQVWPPMRSLVGPPPRGGTRTSRLGASRLGQTGGFGMNVGTSTVMLSVSGCPGMVSFSSRVTRSTGRSRAGTLDVAAPAGGGFVLLSWAWAIADASSMLRNRRAGRIISLPPSRPMSRRRFSVWLARPRRPGRKLEWDWPRPRARSAGAGSRRCACPPYSSTARR